ncbi:MAG: hypothetical protein GVY30_10515 [Chloroflexi bacterium]|jgi:NAD(P)-dependent dehydrogenase (short-subunit alcohol dehydrogenase family)|nr:hypothetical protein [Chloroflexota bacterium]
MTDNTFLILGGGGLVGLQIARRIANDLTPKRIVIASLHEDEVQEALNELHQMFGDKPIEFEGVYGNIFVRSDFTDKSRGELLGEPEHREALYTDLLGPPDAAYERSRLVEIVQTYQPDVIVDSINTATAISYQNVYTASRAAKRKLDALFETVQRRNAKAGQKLLEDTEQTFETLLISQAIPQLIRHVILLNQVLRDVGARLYLKIGTTGTGGMGLNIPYTHGEDKPSATLMSKTAIAFAHTGLMFLMARTVGGPIVKEIKPGAMIGYAEIAHRPVRERGKPVNVYSTRTDALGDTLMLRANEDEFEQMGPLTLPVVDTGENGIFTRGEFEAITSLRQMEFLTPEEIAREVLLEIIGSNTGHDVIAAIDGAVMPPTYRAGYLRQQALEELTQLEEETETHSIALGQLGPPQLSKLLWEAELLRLEFQTLNAVLEHAPEAIATKLYRRVKWDAKLRRTITSIGVPILAPEGDHLLRGPFIRIPEVDGAERTIITSGDIDRWAAKGWVDLRPSNFEQWQARFETMEKARQRVRGRGSAAIIREAYLFEDIRPGTIVGWIFNNEEAGYRIK